MPADRNPLVIEAISSPDAPYYVYLLVDPETGRPFYVGKGTGERFRAHGIEAALWDDADSAAERRRKVTRIRAITDTGREPQVLFARTRIRTEREAFLVEAALIDALGRFGDQLVNEVRGHGTDTGLISLDDLERELTATEFTITEPAILIKLYDWKADPEPDVPRLGHGFRPGMTPRELYDSTRAWWVLDQRRASRHRYAVAVHRGITRAAWEIDPSGWRHWDRAGDRVRWAFEGWPAAPEIHEAFVGRLGRRVPRLRPDGRPLFGQANPIGYWPR